MIVGVMTAKLNLQGIHSLKEKRGIVKGLTARLRNRFNASVAEVDHNDSKQSAVIGITIAANDGAFIDSRFDAVVSFMRRDGRFYLGQTERETFNA